MSRFLRLAQFSGSHSINLPQLKSFTFGPYLSCPGCLPLFKSPSLLPVPFPSPSSSGSPSCRVTLNPPVPEAGPDLRLALHPPSTTELLHFRALPLLPVPFPSPLSSGSPSCRLTLHPPLPPYTTLFRSALHQPSTTEILHFRALSILSRLLASVQITIPPAGTVPIAQLQRLVFMPGHSRSTGSRG